MSTTRVVYIPDVSVTRILKPNGVPIAVHLVDEQRPAAVLHHKFIVLRPSGGYDSAPLELTLVIGPRLNGESYEHRALVECSRRAMLTGEVAGGGVLDIEPCDWAAPGTKWLQAHFRSLSSSLGPFDPKLLEDDSRRDIRVALGMPCLFEWMMCNT